MTTQRKKRLCVLSDGTWTTPDNPSPSNVAKLTKAILREGSDGIQQVLMYDKGLGTGGLLDRLAGGALGVGIDINIQELYSFLALNYDDGDEIYMFGYSRGAYSVRSLAGMIDFAGLVRRDKLEFVNDAYELYRTSKSAENDKAVAFRKEHGDRVPITLIACFDTVGALGLPENLAFLDLRNRTRYEFHDTTLNARIQNAVHVLSIDEESAPLKPTFMEEAEGETGQLTQLYFWGGHGGVSGSEPRQPECGQLTLRFVIDEMSKRKLGLTFNMSQIPDYPDVDVEQRNAPPVGIQAVVSRVLGKFIRPITDKSQVHPTAIKRYQQVSSWRPAALKNIADDILKMIG